VHVLFIIIFFTIIIFLFINYHDYLDVLLDSHFASHVLVFLTARHDPSVRVYCVQDTHTPPIQPHYIRLHYITMINHVPCVCKHIGHTHTYYRARALSLSLFLSLQTWRRVLIVSSGKRATSTEVPAHPPASSAVKKDVSLPDMLQSRHTHAPVTLHLKTPSSETSVATPDSCGAHKKQRKVGRDMPAGAVQHLYDAELVKRTKFLQDKYLFGLCTRVRGAKNLFPASSSLPLRPCLFDLA